ncbi:MAG: FIST C-terminal domain-containing protein [Nitrospirae bacterium]|nr:FIST C-terminal domain-containing protein [Candidatus Manganitrophaceae bacterium]
MQWASSLSQDRDVQSASKRLVQQIHAQIGKDPVDLAFLFTSSHFQHDDESILETITGSLQCRTLIGCSGGGIIGGGKEVEHRPAMALTVARLPGVEMTPFHLDSSDLPDLDASPKKWESCFGIAADRQPHFILFADPFSFEAEKGLIGLDFAYAAATKIGGLASGGSSAGQNGLFLNRTVYRSGLVGVALSGNVEIDTIVAQGCRPIGTPLPITQCNRNLLITLDHKPPIEVLQELYEQLSEEDQKLMQHSLFLGLAMTPFKDTLVRGDFLIRNLVGMDSKSGSLAVGALLREGQMVQFHLRDAETSAEDLKWYLTQYQIEGKARSARGALLFSCLGRGEHLYGESNHDSNLFHSQIGPLPLGGFFCNGEIGAVGGSTFLHGYTSCFGIFKGK